MLRDVRCAGWSPGGPGATLGSHAPDWRGDRCVGVRVGSQQDSVLPRRRPAGRLGGGARCLRGHASRLSRLDRGVAACHVDLGGARCGCCHDRGDHRRRGVRNRGRDRAAHRLGGADERAKPERRSDGKAGLRQEAGHGRCGPLRGPVGQQFLAAAQRHDRQGGKGPRADQDGLRWFRDRHRGPGAGRVRLLLLGQRVTGPRGCRARSPSNERPAPTACLRACLSCNARSRSGRRGVGPSGGRSLSGDLPQRNRRCTTATTRTMGLIDRAWLWSRIRAPVWPGGSRARRTCDACGRSPTS